MAIVLPKEFQMETVLEQEQEIGFGISISKRSSNSSSLISAVTSANSNLGLGSVQQTRILSARTWRMEGKTLQYRRKCVQHVQLDNGMEKTVLKESGTPCERPPSQADRNIVTLVPLQALVSETSETFQLEFQWISTNDEICNLFS